MTQSANANTYTYAGAKGEAAGTANAQVSDKASIAESRAVSTKGTVQAGASTDSKTGGDTETKVKASGSSNIVANTVVVDKAHSSAITANS
jgi:hypothetical protein